MRTNLLSKIGIVLLTGASIVASSDYVYGKFVPKYDNPDYMNKIEFCIPSSYIEKKENCIPSSYIEKKENNEPRLMLPEIKLFPIQDVELLKLKQELKLILPNAEFQPLPPAPSSSKVRIIHSTDPEVPDIIIKDSKKLPAQKTFK